jgi:hypothetical protein
MKSNQRISRVGALVASFVVCKNSLRTNHYESVGHRKFCNAWCERPGGAEHMVFFIEIPARESPRAVEAHRFLRAKRYIPRVLVGGRAGTPRSPGRFRLTQARRFANHETCVRVFTAEHTRRRRTILHRHIAYVANERRSLTGRVGEAETVGHLYALQRHRADEHSPAQRGLYDRSGHLQVPETGAGNRLRRNGQDAILHATDRRALLPRTP